MQYSGIANLRNLQFTVTHALGFPVSTSRILATVLKSLTMTKSSNHTLSLHRLTFHTSSTTNFPWPYSTDNSVPILLYSVVRRCIPILLTLSVKVKLLHNWQFIANQFVLAPGPLRPTTRDFFPTELLW
jgi:hypothetical protein